MTIQSLFLTVILLCSCHSVDKRNSTSNIQTASKVTVPNKTPVGIALSFLNDYVKNINKEEKAVRIVEWVNSNKLTTKHFKIELKKMEDKANKEDPEIGMDGDPILDAQDNPEKGFELDSFDSKANYIIAKGIDWPDFKVTVKMIEENGKWLVDGCGIVNIPEEKRIH